MRDLIRLALKEDIGSGDATCGLVKDRSVAARIVAGENLVLSGIDVAKEVFRMHDRRVRFVRRKKDGSRVCEGEIIAEIGGSLYSVLACERTALNFVQHLSGIATNASKFSAEVKDTGVVLLDTRKTTPGLRNLEKKACLDGGISNHRFGLYDMILLKDNHLAAEGLTKILLRLQKKKRRKKVEVEVDSFAQLSDVLHFSKNIDIVMLDNFSLSNLKKAVSLIRLMNKKLKIEYSGRVNLSNVGKIARTGVDYVSIGSALTLSSRAIDLRLEIH